ncbi:MAG: helix-turn-helix domain-containing protein [Oscillospiraceae bacterium]
MSFGENLRTIRKERNITQEELADMMEVSRQAISKWESDQGYPETEKLIILSQKLNISIDYLVNEKTNAAPDSQDRPVVYTPSGKITIASFDKSSIGSYQAVKSSKILGNGKGLAYILYGVEKTSFWGEDNTILGWYRSLDDVKKEITAINEAITCGECQYELKFYTNVEYRGLFGQPHIVE